MFSELDNYKHRLEDLHQQVMRLLESAPAEALNWRPVESGEEHVTNSIAVLAAHLAGSEHYWIGEVIGGLPPTRNRPAEFATLAEGASSLCETYQQTHAETQQVLAGLKSSSLDEVRAVEGRMVPVRWAILNVIDHTALHLGHLQLTFQLWMGGQSAQSPHWYERLPNTYQQPPLD